MNRRSFFRFLTAAPAAAVVVPTVRGAAVLQVPPLAADDFLVVYDASRKQIERALITALSPLHEELARNYRDATHCKRVRL